MIPDRLKNRALGLLWLIGSPLAIVTTLLPRPHGPGAPVVVGLSALAAIWGAAMLVGVFDRWGAPYQHAAIALIQVLITIGYVATDQPASDLRLYYIWVTPCAALFFGRRAATLHTAWGAVLVGAGLAAIGVGLLPGLSLWLTTCGSMAATAALVGWAVMLAQRSRSRLQHLADHDPLTGLPNRRLFGRRLGEALRDPVVTTAVLIVDLDSFKDVNESHGHESGDLLLRQLVPRLGAQLGPDDVLARLGGDEFAVLHRVASPLSGSTRTSPSAVDSAIGLAERLSAAWAQPFAVAGGLYTSGCVGVAVSQGPRIAATALMREADAALYRAKELGRSSIHLYDERLRQHVQRRFDLENALRDAVLNANHELEVAYQPVVLLDSGRLTGVEALCRWHSPTLGEVMPEEFIPVAEDSGLIHELGRHVLKQASSTLERWLAAGLVDDEFVLAVNVSPIQVRNGFADQLAELMQATGLRPQSVALELTERVLMDDSAATVRELAALRTAGHSLMLDDFGTGFSALSYLAALPVDVVKIDRSFVSALDTDARREAVVQAVLRMAEALGLAVIAEGVETAGQRQRLRELGCHYAQGWLFGRSTPAGAFEVFLRERRRGLGAIEALPAQPTQLTQLAETRREGCDVVTADETVGLQT